MSERYINNLTGDFSICFSEHLTEHPTKYMPFVYDEANFLTNQKCFIITGQNIMAHHWYCYQ